MVDRRWRACSLVVVALGCGRWNFTEHEDAGVIIDTPMDTPVDLNDGLRLHLDLDSTGLFRDRVTGVDVTCAACPGLSPGRIGDGAAAFTGAECLRVADRVELRAPRFSAALWVRPSSAQESVIFGRPYRGATTVNDSWDVGVLDQPNRLAFGSPPVLAETPVVLDIWTHVAGTFDGTDAVLYIDGVLRASSPSAMPQLFNDDLRVGCDLDIGLEAFQFKGELDDVRYYDRVLSPAEIQALAMP